MLLSYTWGDDSTKLLTIGAEERFQTFREIVHRIHSKFASYLEPVGDEVIIVDWQMEPFHHGAFKLQSPSQDQHLRAAYYQYLSVLDPSTDKGVYLAGDSVSWAGGWVEGALQTGLNAACAVAHRLGGSLSKTRP